MTNLAVNRLFKDEDPNDKTTLQVFRTKNYCQLDIKPDPEFDMPAIDLRTEDIIHVIAAIACVDSEQEGWKERLAARLVTLIEEAE